MPLTSPLNRELREALRQVAQQGVGILMVTHHLADILPEIDRVIMMKDGRIFADGPKKELLTPEKLRRPVRRRRYPRRA